MSWSQVTQEGVTWTGVSDTAATWGAGVGSFTTLRNSSRFIRMDGSSDGTGGIDFVFLIKAVADDYRFFIETAVPVSIRSTHNNPMSPA